MPPAAPSSSKASACGDATTNSADALSSDCVALTTAAPGATPSASPPSATATTSAGAALHLYRCLAVACSGGTANGGVDSRPSRRFHSAYCSAAPGAIATRSAGESSSGGDTCSVAVAAAGVPRRGCPLETSDARTTISSSALAAATALTGTR